MRAVDEQPVWSIICFVVPAQYRGEGVARELLRGAMAYAKKCGARLLEAYPWTRTSAVRDDSMWFRFEIDVRRGRIRRGGASQTAPTGGETTGR
jgi:GNAT superfamily N-acetyltransferase